MLLSSASLLSCDTFHGSLVAMTITWPFYPPACMNGMMNMPPGCQVVPQPLFIPTASQRIEMWGRFGSGQIRRLAADVGTNDETTFTGFSLVPAIDPNDTCLIRGLDLDDQECGSGNPTADASICGAAIFSKKASTGPGVSDNDALLIQQQLVLQGRKITSVTTPFLAVDSMTTGSAIGPLLALVQWNPDYATDPRRVTLPPLSTANAVDSLASSLRLSQCVAYRDGDGKNIPGHPYFYVGNPHQVTKPLSGVQFGFLAFSTGPGSLTPNLPAQNFNGMSFSLPYAADDITEILITLESAPPPAVYGLPSSIPLFSAKRMPDSTAGRGVIRLVVLANTTPPLMPGPIPQPTYSVAVGTVSILSGLDSGIK